MNLSTWNAMERGTCNFHPVRWTPGGAIHESESIYVCVITSCTSGLEIRICENCARELQMKLSGWLERKQGGVIC